MAGKTLQVSTTWSVRLLWVTELSSKVPAGFLPGRGAYVELYNAGYITPSNAVNHEIKLRTRLPNRPEFYYASINGNGHPLDATTAEVFPSLGAWRAALKVRMGVDAGGHNNAGAPSRVDYRQDNGVWIRVSVWRDQLAQAGQL